MGEKSELGSVVAMLAQWESEVRLLNSGNYTDINHVSENFALRLLNAAFDYDLINLNWIGGNYPAVDLGDKKRGIAIQVTATNKYDKIKKSLKKFYAQNGPYKDFPQGIIFFFLTEKPPKLKAETKRNLQKIALGFNPDKHIWTMKTLFMRMEELYSTDRNKFDKVKEILEEEFPQSNHRNKNKRASAKMVADVLSERKSKVQESLKRSIANKYHMRLKLELEVEKIVEVKNKISGEIEKRKENVWESVQLETILRDRENYLLVNSSGMGKTVFLNHAADALLNREKDQTFMPLLTTCIDLNKQQGSIADYIKEQVESSYCNSQTAIIDEEWQNLCILLDALVQAPNVNDILYSLQFNQKEINYKKAKIVLSSRENTVYRVEDGFKKIRLKLPETDEVRQYLQEENYRKLEKYIVAYGELTKAPILLEMLKTITEEEGDISKLWSRSDLYTEFFKILVKKELKKVRFSPDDEEINDFIENEMEQALEKIAFFSLVDKHILEIEKAKFNKYCKPLVKKKALLNSGIILKLFEDREQKVLFLHQSFQAYFAARFIYFRRRRLFEKLVDNIAFFYSDVWYEVIHFFVGLEKNPKKAGDIIDLISVKAPTNNVFNKIVRWCKQKFNIYDHTLVLRWMFAAFLMSDAQVSSEKVRDIHEQLGFLLSQFGGYWYFFHFNIDKFNPGNNEQLKSLSTVFKTIIKDESGAYNASELLAAIRKPVDPPFKKHLARNISWNVRHDAAEELKRIGVNDIILLEPLLKDEDSNVRRAATKVLGEIGTSSDVRLLKPLIKDENDSVRSEAAIALGRIGKTKDISLLEPLFSDDNEWVGKMPLKH